MWATTAITVGAYFSIIIISFHYLYKDLNSRRSYHVECCCETERVSYDR